MNLHLQPFFRTVFLGVISLSLCASGIAQNRSTPVDSSVSGEKLAVEQGRQAMAEGQHEVAAKHFLYALSRTSKSPRILELLLENAAQDPDAFALWAVDYCVAMVKADGRLKLLSAAKDLLEAAEKEETSVGVIAQQLAKARAKAVRELQRQITKYRKARKAGSKISAEWMEDFARAVAAPSPQLVASIKQLNPQIEAGPADWRPVLDALKRSANSSLSSAKFADAIRAGRCLKGLAAQAGFDDDLKGPKPSSLSAEAAVANATLGRARAVLARKPDLLYTIEDLQSMGVDEQRELTLDRASFSRPSVCNSPRDWYRIETSCGWETLLGAATTVEYHHDRLVNWYGRDPFIDRPGTVRLVPEAHGLESEGTPFWWAGGFQGGDTTVLKFTMSNIPGLGRGLTHELTHRFDGGVYGGLPGWLSEGRASWTGGAYGSMKEKNFVANHCSFGTMGGTLGLGYGRQEELEKLVAGTIEEYRDNYTAGYSLFVYLNTWSGAPDVDLTEQEIEDGPTDAMTAHFGKKPIYHDRLQSFMEEKKRLRNDPVKVFTYYFADGKKGRPDGMKEFTRRFEKFMQGFGGPERAAWTSRYTQNVPPGDPAPTVYDEPTWTWLRNRAEPWFGQDHARQVGELFADLGKHEEAVDAFTWSLGVDEPSLSTQLRFADELRLAGNADAAWMMLHWPRFHAGGVREFLNPAENVDVEVSIGPTEFAHVGAFNAVTSKAAGPAPFARKLSAVRELMKLQEAAAAQFAKNGKSVAATAVWADRNLLAQWLGLPEMGRGEIGHSVADGDEIGHSVADDDGTGGGGIGRGVADEGELSPSKLHPFNAPWRLQTFAGWSEPDLTGHEDDRIIGLWTDDSAGALHVGRREARGGTGQLDRASHQRNAVVFSNEWMDAGRYQFRAQVDQTTAYLSAGLVFGWTRRDRNVRLGFSMGDWAYAVGQDKELEKINGLHWSLDGLYARRGAQRGSHTFGKERHHFELLIDVDGPTAEVYFDDILCATYSTLDGSAIQGRIGFYTTTGTMKILHPETRRLPRSQFEPGARAVGDGLHPLRPGAEDWRTLIGRPVSGVPLAASGTVILWFPEQSDQKLQSLQDGEWYGRIADDLDSILDILEPEFPSQGLLLMVPTSFPESDLQSLEEGFGGILTGGFAVRRHARPETLAEDQRTIQGWTMPVLAFVDPTGFLRYARRQSRMAKRIPADLRMLLIKLQDHSRPGTAGAGD